MFVVGGIVEIDCDYGKVLFCVSLWVLVIVLVVVYCVLWFVVNDEGDWIGFVVLVVDWFYYIVLYWFVVGVGEVEEFEVVDFCIMYLVSVEVGDLV